MTTRTCRQVPAIHLPYLAQDGWIYDEHGMTRKPRMVPVKTQWLDMRCQYDKQHLEAICADCPRRNKGEA